MPACEFSVLKDGFTFVWCNGQCIAFFSAVTSQTKTVFSWATMTALKEVFLCIVAKVWSYKLLCIKEESTRKILQARNWKHFLFRKAAILFPVHYFKLVIVKLGSTWPQCSSREFNRIQWDHSGDLTSAVYLKEGVKCLTRRLQQPTCGKPCPELFLRQARINRVDKIRALWFWPSIMVTSFLLLARSFTCPIDYGLSSDISN